jgi:hypothetical protein
MHNWWEPLAEALGKVMIGLIPFLVQKIVERSLRRKRRRPPTKAPRRLQRPRQ